MNPYRRLDCARALLTDPLSGETRMAHIFDEVCLLFPEQDEQGPAYEGNLTLLENGDTRCKLSRYEIDVRDLRTGEPRSMVLSRHLRIRLEDTEVRLYQRLPDEVAPVSPSVSPEKGV